MDAQPGDVPLNFDEPAEALRVRETE
jgi:hypothetical protein